MDEKTVLVVEESSVISDLVRDLLEAAKLSVVQASKAKDGLALVEEQGFDAILVDADMPVMDGYALLGEIRKRPGHERTPVLVLTDRGREKETRAEEVIQPNDYIQMPIDPVDLIVRVRAAVGRATPAVSLNGSSAEPNYPRSTLAGEGKIITVYSLKGGVGTSMVATNLAVALRKLWDESVAVVDLSLEAGTLNVLFDIIPTSTLDELVAQNGNVTPDVIGQYLIAHKSGVSLLSAPASPERAELVSAQALRSVLSVLRVAFDYVVIDTASNFADYSLVALEMADNIVLPLTGDIASVRATTTAMDIFQALSIQDSKVVTVFNEIFPKAGLTKKHVENNLHLTMSTIPSGGGKLLDSINLGTPILLTDPDAPISVALENLAYELSRDESRDKDRAKPSDRYLKLKKRLKV